MDTQYISSSIDTKLTLAIGNHTIQGPHRYMLLRTSKRGGSNNKNIQPISRILLVLLPFLLSLHGTSVYPLQCGDIVKSKASPAFLSPYPPNINIQLTTASLFQRALVILQPAQIYKQIYIYIYIYTNNTHTTPKLPYKLII